MPASDINPDPVIVCTLALAPASKPDDANLNSDVRFQIYVEKELYGTVGEAARTLVEESHSNIFLPFLLNRSLDTTTIGTVALELIYGSGYRTFMQRKDGPEVKSYKQLGICLKIGYGGDDDDVDKLPILMPDDDLYTHLLNTDLDIQDPQKQPVLYICTGGPLFLYPADTKNQSSISLTVPTKRGYWTGASYDSKSDPRGKYPKVLPNKAGAVTRKRKKPDESETKTIESGSNENKKVKKAETEDDDEKPSEKPAKKKTVPKKKTTPKKPVVEKKEKQEATDEEEEESGSEEEEKPVPTVVKKKRSTSSKKTTPKKISKKEDADVDDEEELEEKSEEPAAKRKPVAKQRKSSGSVKSKSNKKK